jgi:intein/homing endonuclease
MRKLTPELAEILGLLCAEGCHNISYSTYIGWFRNRPRLHVNKRSERIELYNKDKKLLLRYKHLLEKEFSYVAKITKGNKINIGTREVIREIVEYTELGNEKWLVPELISLADDQVKIAFIRGYFDGDGTASNTIRFFSVNKQGILEVFNLVRSLGFKVTFQGPILKSNRKPAYIIQLSRKERERFLKTIRPVSKVTVRDRLMWGLSSD